MYETRYVDKLDKKTFKIDCYDYDRIGSNDYIGIEKTSDIFHQPRCRWLHHRSTHSRNWPCSPRHSPAWCTPIICFLFVWLDPPQGGRPAGRLEFDLQMEQVAEVTVTLKEVQVSGLAAYNADGTSDPYLQFFYSGRWANNQWIIGNDEQQRYKGVQISHTKSHIEPLLARFGAMLLPSLFEGNDDRVYCGGCEAQQETESWSFPRRMPGSSTLFVSELESWLCRNIYVESRINL